MFIRLLPIAAFAFLSSQPVLADSGVRAVLIPAETLNTARLSRTETLLKDRLAKIGANATVSKSRNGQIAVHAPNEINLRFAGTALTQRGVPALWWARPFTHDAPQGSKPGTIAVWNEDWTRPEDSYLSLAFPAAPSVSLPGITRIDRSQPPGANTIPALTVYFDARTKAALTAARHPGDRLVLTVDDDILAVAPAANTASDRITIAAHEVGFNAQPLTATLRTAPLPARMTIAAAPYLGDSPATGLIFANPPQPVTALLHVGQPAATAQTAAALNLALARMTIWGANAVQRPDGTVAVHFDDKHDIKGLSALVDAVPMEWHWGQFDPIGAMPKPGSPASTYGPTVNFSTIPLHLRVETATALHPEDIVGAEIIRPAHDDAPVTLALTLDRSAGNRLHEQMLTRGGQMLFASSGQSAMPSLGGLLPMLTADGRLLLTGLISRDELWPAAAAVLRKDLPARLDLEEPPPPSGR